MFIDVVPNGVDLDQWAPGRSPRERAPIVVFNGRGTQLTAVYSGDAAYRPSTSAPALMTPTGAA